MYINTLDLKSINCNVEGLFLSSGTVGDKLEEVKQNDDKFPSYLSLSGISNIFRKNKINYAVFFYTT